MVTLYNTLHYITLLTIHLLNLKSLLMLVNKNGLCVVSLTNNEQKAVHCLSMLVHSANVNK